MTKVLVKAQLLRSCYEILGAQKSGKESGVMPVTGGGLFRGKRPRGKTEGAKKYTFKHVVARKFAYIEYIYIYING